MALRNQNDRKRIAVVGTGVSGLSAAWLLNKRHDVTVYESDQRVGGHANTVMVKTPDGDIAVDTGFIVYNELTYPNFTALMDHLSVETKASDMSLAISRGGGKLEYSGSDLKSLFGQRRNIVRPRFWSMLRDLVRFYRDAPRDAATLALDVTLGDYLDTGRYGAAFRDDHLLPMAGAIWSAPSDALLAYPAQSFIRFHDNHGLLKISDRPQWRTVHGGSRAYVDALTRTFSDRIKTGTAAASIARKPAGVAVTDADGNVAEFDDVVIATHADQALSLLESPSEDECRLLGAFRYTANRAVLHSDPSMMPRRRKVWASWNHVETDDGDAMVTYWMNALQDIPRETPLFVTLNPVREPRSVHYEIGYDHPLFDTVAIEAQKELWSLQSCRNTWFCGSYFGSGFHEDGLQSGLAVAEQLGQVRRPWTVENESGRIMMTPLASERVLAA